MEQYTTKVGLDVHARSICAKGVNLATGEEHGKTFRGEPAEMEAEVAEWLAKLPQPAYCAYESGCTGFGLARALRAAGFGCDVIAVSTLPTSPKDKKQKCDKLDARAIRSAICNPDRNYSVVDVPDEEVEAARDLCRAWRIAVDKAKEDKQRLAMFLVRHGHVWNEKTRTGKPKEASGREWEKWLDSISFSDPNAEEAFATYRRWAREAAEEARRLRKEVLDLAGTPRFKPYVDAISCLKGLDRGLAMLAAAEFGDFGRFKSGRKVSCWTGTVPTDGSSGDDRKHGRITKAGNKYLRRGLIEGYSGVAAWKSGKKAAPKGAEVSAAALSIAAKANDRLFARYDHLAREERKNANKAKVAVVSELARWIWAIGRQVQAELAQASAARAA